MASEHESWRTVAAELGVKAISPCELTVNGTRVTFTALLPQFGGLAGMIINPDWSVIKPHADALTKAGYGYSCISIDGSAPDEVRDVLLDWGWNGTTARKPAWL
jgi:hypothetical protein